MIRFAAYFLVSSLLCLTIRAAFAEDSPPIRAQEVREGSKVTITGNDKQSQVEVRCDRGINTCQLQRTGKHWPANIELKLHLRGLESLQVTSGGTTVSWSVPSSGEERTLANVRSGNRTAELAPGDAFFTLAKKVKEKEASYFLVPIPAKLLAENPEQIKLQWIDFYR